MGDPPAMEPLAMAANNLRTSLLKSQAITNSMVYTLSSFDNHLSALEASIRPTQVHTDGLRRAERNIDRTLNLIDGILRRFDLFHQVEVQIQKGPHENLKNYFEAIGQLRRIKGFLSSNNGFKSTNDVVIRTNNALDIAIMKMEEEFKELLTSYSKPLEPEDLYNCLPNFLKSSSGPLDEENINGTKNLVNAAYTLPTLIPPQILPQLHDLTEQLAQAERQQQCLKIYRAARSSALEGSLKNLGVEKLGEDDLQKMEWEVLQGNIVNWIQYMRIAVKLLFVAESKLCDQIFDDIDYNNDQCFAEVISNSMARFLNFGEAVSKSERSPEKLFVLLDMCEIMWELQVEIETIFGGQACSKIRESALRLKKCLAQAACETFNTLEPAIVKDTTNRTPCDGKVHPLTSYVMNYVKFLYSYKSTFEQLPQHSESESKENFQLGPVTMRITKALEYNLDMKAKQYDDQALGFLFKMNNMHYMVKSVSGLNTDDFSFHDWIHRHRRRVQQNASQYKKAAWAKILKTLSKQDLATSSGDNKAEGSGEHQVIVSKAIVKRRFILFNMYFEDLHQEQSQWCVSDSELREYLKLSISEVLLTAYQSFLTYIGSQLKPKDLDKYMKYKPEDIENKLADFFQGKEPVGDEH
ncbi:hypothetical protein J5N97_020705 [Dioscorea zingiberensis]|uniref:Exocyst subunit Exo70 family protein n=1 Tax=Dioscorea zingiberensis TaxID=325984 RepID=A0A9D5CGB7_9LILI|nr:hypothetical protein J5N97_020705 [Dioscorea zingiberensis]